MSRAKTEFDDVVNVRVTGDLVKLLRAIGYLRGEGGEYAGPARDFMQTGAEQYIKDLPPQRRERFNQILANVSVSDTLTN